MLVFICKKKKEKKIKMHEQVKIIKSESVMCAAVESKASSVAELLCPPLLQITLRVSLFLLAKNKQKKSQ